MLGSAKLVAFAATTDPEKARAFYEGILGLRLVSDDEFALVFDSNGVTLRVPKVQDVRPAPYTTLGWSVRGIRGVAEALRAKGVQFERYEGMDQDELGIWRPPGGIGVAWFKDPDGNLLSISEASREAGP